MLEYSVFKKTKLNDAYYTVNWSPLTKADKYEIIKKVPAIGGIIQLFYVDDKNKINLFCLRRSWYGGLRSTIRELTDQILVKDDAHNKILKKYEGKIYYRWTATDSFSDMADIIFFLFDTVFPNSQKESSGRYEKIFLKEIDAEKITTI